MRKKKVLHCVCGMPTQTYKKGKGHRIILCPSCGVIATNPIPLALAAASLAAPVAKKLAVAGLKRLGRTAVEKVVSSSESGIPQEGAPSSSKVFHVTDSRDRPNMRERIINRELYGA